MGTYDLCNLNEVKAYLHLTDADISEDVIEVYCTDTGATAATVAVEHSDGYAYNLELVITGGSNAGTSDLDLSSDVNNTTVELAASINDKAQWSANLVGAGNYPSSDMNLRTPTGCLLVGNRLTLTVEDDYLLSMLIEQASTLIENELGFNIISRPYREYHDGSGDPYIWVDQIPVVNIDFASTNRDEAMTVKYTGGDASYATAEVTKTHLRLRKKVSGTTSSDVFALSDYTIGTLDTAVTAVSGWTGLVVSGYTNYSAADLIPIPALYANNAAVELEVPEPNEDEYELEDATTGRLYNPRLWDAGHKNIVVEYTAGYTTTPGPIKSACLDIVKMLYDLTKRDATLKAEKLGDYSYTVADRLDTIFSASGDAQTSNLIMVKLSSYRRKMLRA